jgi:unsaturated rhamnogalacturonyl hydrolase
VLDERAWGTGNGWVVAALARTIPRMPYAASDLAELARATLDACLQCRRADGSFGNHLDDPASFRETPVAAMLAYAALRGATDGWLPQRYGEVGGALLESVVAEIDDVGRVRNACGAPDYVRPGFSPESQAFALLADAAYRRWCDR